MKNKLLLFMIALGAIVFFTGCSDDEKKASSPSLTGTWDVTDAAGVEWEEIGTTGVGEVINTNDPDVDMIGETFVIEGSEITVFGDSYPFEFSDGVLTIDFGGGDTDVFNVEFDGENTMLWTQDEPTKHADYEYNPGGENYLFYQKSFTLEKQ